jgi:O-antigen/teichoic acid export membrane protein
MFITNAVAIGVARLLLGQWGAHDYGIWLVVSQLLGYLDLVDLGVIGLLSRDIASAIGRSGGIAGAHDVPLLVGRTLRVVLWQGPAVAAIAFAIWLFLPAGWESARWPLAAIFGIYVVSVPFKVAHALLEGAQALRNWGLLNNLGWAATTLVTVGATCYGMRLGAAALGFLARVAVTGAGLIWVAARGYPALVPRSLTRVSFAEAGALMRRGSRITLQRIGGLLVTATDNLVADRGFGAAGVVPYACTNKTYTSLENLPLLLVNMARPGLAELRAAGLRDRALKVVNMLSLAALITAGFVACVALSVNRAFVDWWIGDAQWAGQRTSVLLALALVIRAAVNAAMAIVFACGLDRRLMAAALLDGIVTLGSSFALVKALGYVAMPIASIFGGTIVLFPILLPTISKDLQVSVAAILRPVAGWAWRFSFCIAGAYALAEAWTPKSLLAIVATASVVSLAYGLLMLPCILSSALADYIERALGIALKRHPG